MQPHGFSLIDVSAFVMRLRCNSLKCLITAITAGMGLASLLLALLTGGLYRDLTLRGQADEIRRQVQQKTEDARQRLKQHTLQFVAILRNQPGFREHLARRDWQGLSRFLATQYRTPLFASGVLDVVQINVYDERLRLQSRAAKPGKISAGESAVDCGRPDYIRLRNHDAPATRIAHADCVYRNHLFFTSAVPVGLGARAAYLEVVADLAYNLELLEEDIGMPLRVWSKENPAIVYQSARWPSEKILAHAVRVVYDTPAADGPPAARIETAHDLAYLSAALGKTRLLITVATGVATLVIVLLMLAITRRALLEPVNAVIGHLRDVRRDQSRLGERIAPRGTIEIRELAETFNDFSAELKTLHQTLEDSALTDALTRLGNRKQFHASLSDLMNPAERRATPFALLMLDLDRFKQINDTLGHKAGDQFLSQISERFVKELRDTDRLVTPAADEDKHLGNGSIARIGGDEFAVLLPHVDSEERAAAVAKKLAAITDVPFVLGEATVKAGLSIGIALYPKHANNKDALIHKADVAMYRAKKAGGGYTIYDESMEPTCSPATGCAA